MQQILKNVRITGGFFGQVRTSKTIEITADDYFARFNDTRRGM
jgi:hypothetical protein